MESVSLGVVLGVLLFSGLLLWSSMSDYRDRTTAKRARERRRAIDRIESAYKKDPQDEADASRLLGDLLWDDERTEHGESAS